MCIVSTILCILLPNSIYAQDKEPLNKIIAARNPAPQSLPTLNVWVHSSAMVTATFPNAPNFVCDSWCYESELDYIGARALEGGKLELHHRVHQHPHVIIVTTVTPEPGAVEFVARAKLEKEGVGTLPATLPFVNLCWQLQRSLSFGSSLEPYPEFIKRCFIFTEQGRTFLHNTTRRKIPARAPNDSVNNPPFVQMYVGAWQQIPQAKPNEWADYSLTRYTTTVIGAVSRDNKHLVAIANDSATVMAQAWYSCFHNNSEWVPADAPPAKRVWRVKFYVMENNPDALLARVAKDFPNVRHSKRAASGTSQTTNRRDTPNSANPSPPTVVGSDTFQTVGVRNNLPAFRDNVAERLTFSLSWLSGNSKNFDAWRTAARAKVMECLLTPPPVVPFHPKVIAEQDRGDYVARKVVLNLTADSRVLGLMLVPKGNGPFPAVLLLHDHDARFDIGKEKVIQPLDSDQRLPSAKEWVEQCYGGRFIGDELAKRGYVCLAIDALNWSDRAGAGYEGQQALASNLLHLGMSYAGLIAHEDLRAAEFLATRPEVDSKRVAAMGLSVGAFRAWQVAALSDHVSASVAIGWIGTVKRLMAADNNQSQGQSAFTTVHPGLFNYLDYPDVASLACPKPMLFYNGEQDTLFPVSTVREAYNKMRKVWESQGKSNDLETRLWSVGHVFNVEMQSAAFAWLDERLKKTAR
jgi:dienelactone hydrolase